MTKLNKELFLNLLSKLKNSKYKVYYPLGEQNDENVAIQIIGSDENLPLSKRYNLNFHFNKDGSEPSIGGTYPANANLGLKRLANNEQNSEEVNNVIDYIIKVFSK